MTAYESAIRRHFRRNFTVNVAEAALWSVGMACVSTTTVLPLYVAHLTDSALIIGLIPSLELIGWHLPQLFTGNLVERLPRKLPFVLTVSLTERVPYLVLGLFMLLWQPANQGLTLAIVFLLLTWQALSGGFVANAWQDMVAKIILPTHWGTFFGVGSAVGALLGVGGALLSRHLLSSYPYPRDFAYSYLAGSFFFMISWAAIALTVEPAKPSSKPVIPLSAYLAGLPAILKRDANFRAFLLVRSFGTFAGMGSAFMAVHAAQRYHLGDEAAALFTATMLVSQAILNPILGRLGDRRGHKTMIGASFTLQALAMVVAALAPSSTVFLAAFALKAASDAVFMTSGMPIVFQFCAEPDRPTYIGLANTLTAPPLIIAPLLGGLLAGASGYLAVFWVSAILGAVSAVMWKLAVTDPRECSSSASAEPDSIVPATAEEPIHPIGGNDNA